MSSETIRVRACLVVLNSNKLLLVPHYQTDVGAVQWNIPGGKVELGESLETAALREFQEETGYTAEVLDIFATSEVLKPELPYHSVTIAFRGRIISGDLRSELTHQYGEKLPKWFTGDELRQVAYHPPQIVEKALKILST